MGLAHSHASSSTMTSCGCLVLFLLLANSIKQTGLTCAGLGNREQVPAPKSLSMNHEAGLAISAMSLYHDRGESCWLQLTACAAPVQVEQPSCSFLQHALFVPWGIPPAPGSWERFPVHVPSQQFWSWEMLLRSRWETAQWPHQARLGLHHQTSPVLPSCGS